MSLTPERDGRDRSAPIECHEAQMIACAANPLTAVHEDGPGAEERAPVPGAMGSELLEFGGELDSDILERYLGVVGRFDDERFGWQGVKRRQQVGRECLERLCGQSASYRGSMTAKARQ